MSFLKDTIKITGNEFAGIAEDGLESDIVGFVDTGVYALNALLSGSLYKGMPANKIMAIAGASTVGKSLFSLSIVKSFLDSDKDSICIYFDTEGAITSDMIKGRGIDAKRVGVMGVVTVEEFRNQTIKIVDSYLALPISERKPILIVLDSLGMLSTNKEIADTAEGKDTKDMTRAQMIKSTFRVLTLKLSKAGIPMIVCNHTYDQIGTMYPEKIMGGGTGTFYASSTVLFLSKRKEKQDNEVVGNVIHCLMKKGRFTKENSMVDVLLRYDTGLNKYYGLLPIAEKYGIFKKVSTRYEMPDGSKAFEKNIIENPEKYYTKEVMDQLEEAVKKEFMYGSDFEAVAAPTEEK